MIRDKVLNEIRKIQRISQPLREDAKTPSWIRQNPLNLRVIVRLTKYNLIPSSDNYKLEQTIPIVEDTRLWRHFEIPVF